MNRSMRQIRKAFSLAEVMFAVMILGIGFIMLASMFPVALQQARETKESVTASTVFRRARQVVQDVARSTDSVGVAMMPSTENGSDPFGDFSYRKSLGDWSYPLAEAPPTAGCVAPFWMAIRGELIEPSDPRFAWTAVYRRDPGALNAQVLVFVAAVQEASAYDSGDVGTNLPPLPRRFPPMQVNLALRLVEIRSAGAGKIAIREATGMPLGYHATDAVGVGGYVVPATNVNGIRGRILRVSAMNGRDASNALLCDLEPGADATESVQYESAWILGKTYDAATDSFVGKVQDLAVYSTYVAVP